MAAAAYTGTITAGGTLVKDITSIDFTPKMDTDETTSFSQTTIGTKTFIPTLLGSQFKLSGSRNSSDAGQSALRTAFTGRTKAAIVFKPEGSTETYTCDCWVTDFGVKSDPKSAVKLDVSLVMDGALTVA